MADDLSEALKSVAAGASIMFAGAMVSKAIMYVYRIVVARYLGPADYGVLSLALGVFWVSVTLSHLGIPAGVERFVSDYRGRDEDTEAEIRGTIFSGLVLTVPWSIVVAATVFLGAPLIATYAFQDPSIAVYIQVFALGIPFQILFKNAAKISYAFQEFRYVVVVDKLYLSLATLGVTVVLVFLGYGLMGAVLAQLVAIVSASLLLLYLLQTRVFPVLSRSVPAEREYRDLFHFSWPLFLTGILGLVIGWTDTFMLGYFDTKETVGVYNAALPTAQLLLVVGGTVSTALFPAVSTLYGSGDKAEAIRVASTAIKWMFAIAFPGLLLMVAFAGPILRLLFGSAYTGGAIALGLLGTAYFVQVVTSHAGSFIKAEDMTKLSFLNSSLVAGLNVVFNYALIPVYGVTGAALAAVGGTVIGSLLALVEVWYFFDVQPYRPRRLLPPLLAALGSAAATYGAMKAVFPVTPTWALVPALVLFGLLYGALFIALGGLTDEDLEVLRRVDDRTPADLEPLKNVVRRLRR